MIGIETGQLHPKSRPLFQFLNITLYQINKNKYNMRKSIQVLLVVLLTFECSCKVVSGNIGLANGRLSIENKNGTINVVTRNGTAMKFNTSQKIDGNLIGIPSMTFQRSNESSGVLFYAKESNPSYSATTSYFTDNQLKASERASALTLALIILLLYDGIRQDTNDDLSI